MNRHVLVTGATGRLGRALLPLLRERAVRVYGLARHATRHLAPPEAVPVDCDITDAEAMQHALEQIAVDGIVHLAEVGRDAPATDPDEILRVNILGTHNLLRWATECGTARFVLASTAAVTDSPYGVYANSKCIAEQCCAHAARTSPLHVCTVRFGAVSDAGERTETARAIVAALEHTPQRPFERFDVSSSREVASKHEPALVAAMT